MKNILIFSLILAFTLPVLAPVAHAQTFTAEQQTTLESLNQTLIDLLTKMIAQLQAQIEDLIAKQATTQTQIGAVEAKVDAVQTQTAPVAVQAPVVPSITIGEPTCDLASKGRKDEKVVIPITITGKWRTGTITADYAHPSYVSVGTNSISIGGTSSYRVPNNVGATTVSVELDNGSASKQLVIGDICQSGGNHTWGWMSNGDYGWLD